MNTRLRNFLWGFGSILNFFPKPPPPPIISDWQRECSYKVVYEGGRGESRLMPLQVAVDLQELVGGKIVWVDPDA